MANLGDYDFDEEEKAVRLVSIDALRGFDMFWILGAGVIARSLPTFSESPWVARFAEQLEHVPWDGFHFYDLIFPLFVFVMGVSTVFSLDRIVLTQGENAAYWRIVRRGVVLYLLGILYHGGMIRDPGDVEQFRYLGVLHRIAICYVIGGFLYLNVRWRGLLVTAMLLLGVYWALLSFVPVLGHGEASWEEGTNLANYIDTQFLPGYKWDGDWDPEGLLSTLPAIVSGLLGIFAGMILRSNAFSDLARVMLLLLIGVAGIAAGFGWHIAPEYYCPVIKKLWSPSFVLYAAGWSFVLVAIFHAVVDLAKFDIWARPFVWIGMNPITLYMLGNVMGRMNEHGEFVSGYRQLVDRIALDHWMAQIQPYDQPLIAVVTLLVPIAIAWCMYRNKAFIRV